MLGPLVKAQLVAFLTKKLLESPTFVGGVQALHGSVTRLQQGAYDTLLQATEEHDRKNPTRHLRDEATETSHRPRADETPREQNKELLAFIERTKRELEKEQQTRR
ncbi:hypothetical protein BMF94_3428 [Rhodotorula taiwanensis]|uniref:Uncharacterized protein n=1 Tax=Rhodotorula taiwanensis TaxID=741276 RepID=A0A2S5B9U5_9BASI|nr:hypothetical protein BMF94_3428 [Rhodotorula taiwanensis]